MNITEGRKMENNELVRRYELVVIVDARLANEEKESILNSAKDVIAKAGGKVINSQVWLEKHKFSFLIKKCSDGTYYLINFESNASVIAEIRTALKLNEKILRFVIIKVE